MGRPLIDLTGQRFGKLTVRCKTDLRTKDRKILWLCDCDCGNTRLCTSTNLKSGYKTCGKCLVYNTYEEKEDYMIGHLHNGKEFYFDKEDYDKVKRYTWYDDKGYIRSNEGAMHRILMNAPEDMVVDHINHVTYDNRKINLRICTISQNNCNRKKTKGYTLRQSGKYEVSMVINGINTYIGYFNTKEEAIAARKSAYDEDHKKFCFNNDINKGE